MKARLLALNARRKIGILLVTVAMLVLVSTMLFRSTPAQAQYSASLTFPDVPGGIYNVAADTDASLTIRITNHSEYRVKDLICDYHSAFSQVYLDLSRSPFDKLTLYTLSNSSKDLQWYIEGGIKSPNGVTDVHLYFHTPLTSTTDTLYCSSALGQFTTAVNTLKIYVASHVTPTPTSVVSLTLSPTFTPTPVTPTPTATAIP